MLRVLLGLLLVGAIAYVLLLPPLARRRVLAALRDVDPWATVELHGVSPWRLQLANVALGERRWLAADAVDVRYRPLELLVGGRVRTARVTGLEWRLGVREGAIDPGFRPRRGTEPAGGALDFLGRLDLSRAVVVIDAAGREVRVPLDAQLVAIRSGGHRLSVQTGAVTLPRGDGWSAVSGAALTLDVALDGRLEPGAGRVALRADRIDMPGLALRDAVVEIGREGPGPMSLRVSAVGDDLVRVEAAGRIIPPAEILAGGSWTGEADLDALVALPARARGWLRDRGLVVEAAAPATVAGTVELRAEPAAWSARVSGGRASFDGWTLEAAGSGAVARDVAARLDFEADIDAGGVVVRATRDGSIVAAGLEGAEGRRAVTGPVRAVVAPLDGGPLLAWAAGGADSCAAARIVVADAVSVDTASIAGSLAGLELAGLVCLDSAGTPMIDLTATVADAALRLPAADVTLDGLRMRVPVTFGLDEPREGSFTIAGVQAGGRALGPASGRVAVRDGRMTATGETSLPGGLDVEASADLALGGGGATGAVRAEARPAAITDPEAFARLLGLERGARVGGTWSIEADLALDGEAVESTARVVLDGATLDLPEQDLEARGIDAAVTFGSLAPPATRGRERLTMQSGRVGRVPLRGATVDFRFDASGDLLVESATWTMGDTAEVTATAFRVAPDCAECRTTLSVERLSLAYWLPLLTEGRAQGEGMLSGRLPVTIRPRAAEMIGFGEGFLHAGGRGWITTPEAQQLGALLDRSDPRFATDASLQAVKQRLVGALGDYQYDLLRFDLVPAPDGPTLRIFTSGRGRRGQSPQEIGSLTVNVHDIDSVLSRVFSLRRAMNHAADDALDRFYK